MVVTDTDRREVDPGGAAATEQASANVGPSVPERVLERGAGPRTPEGADFLKLVRQRPRGRLKVYIGSAAGVGKTYRMLNEAFSLRRRGVDVVVGFVETHGRAETAAQTADLEIIPRRRAEYRGATLEEMDLDAIIARHPDVVIVDELAHSNVPGSKHRKRWQDVLELLDAGINVISAVNVQHLESLNDVVQRALGVTVRETVPDWVVARADQVVNIDISAEDLRQRLLEGKIYDQAKVPTALENFFTDENLTTLRELALREVASSVDRAREDIVRQETGGKMVPSKTAERILVAMASNPPRTAALLRKASRIAGRLNSDWYCVYVQTPEERADRIDATVQRRLVDNIQMAQAMGAEVVKLDGEDVVEAICRFAKEHGVTLVMVGQSTRPWWHKLRHGFVVDRLVNNGQGLDVQVVSFVDMNGAGQATKVPAAKVTPSVGRVGADKLDVIDKTVRPLISELGRARNEGAAREHVVAERADEYAEIANEIIGVMTARLEEAELPLHVLLSSPFGELNENQEEMLAAAQSSVGAADTEVRRLRFLIDLDRGAVAFVPQATGLSELLRPSLAITEAHARTAHVNFRAHVSDTAPRVLADPVHTQSALTAIFGDVVSRTPVGGEIETNAFECDAGRIRITVTHHSASPRRAASLDMRVATRLLSLQHGSLLEEPERTIIELPCESGHPSAIGDAKRTAHD